MTNDSSWSISLVEALGWATAGVVLVIVAVCVVDFLHIRLSWLIWWLRDLTPAERHQWWKDRRAQKLKRELAS